MATDTLKMNGKWTADNFKKYDNENPELYEFFVKFTKISAQHREHYSAKAIFHRIRWETMITGDGDYKVDDGWISHYARKFMEEFPKFNGYFQTRDRVKSYHNKSEAQQ